MSLIKREKVCVASGFEGQLLHKGKPLSGAKVERQFKWKDEKGETEHVITDNNGTFRFPTHWDVLKRAFPTQFIVSQEIFVYHNGENTKSGRQEK